MQLRLDSSNRPLLGAWPLKPATKIMTFDGGTDDDPGDQSGSGNPAALFNVTGLVRCALIAVATTLPVGATATLEVGTAVDTDVLLAQTTATDLTAGLIWHDASPAADVEASSVLVENVVSGNIIQTLGTADLTAGAIEYTLLWVPLSKNGNVEAAS